MNNYQPNASIFQLGAGARTACLERARLREDNDLHSEAWVLVTQATDTLVIKGWRQNSLPKTMMARAFLVSIESQVEKSQEEEMNLEQRFDLVTRGTIEVIQPIELQSVLEEKKKPRAYWGFECSGKRLATI